MNGLEYKALREKLGLTQAGLAALLGVTRKTVNSRETGAVRITEEAALAISALRISGEKKRKKVNYDPRAIPSSA